VVSKLEEGGKVSYPDGTLVKGTGPGIYLIDQGKKRPFKSARDFTSLKYKWTQAKTLSDQELEAIPLGTEMVGE